MSGHLRHLLVDTTLLRWTKRTMPVLPLAVIKFFRRLPIIKQLRWWQRFSWRADALQANQELLARAVMGKPEPTLTDDPHFGEKTTLCREAHFRMPLYQRWCGILQETPSFRRKQWEYVYILAAIEQAGLWNAGKSALGFGVGQEKIPALLASKNIQVLATDQSLSTGKQSGWVDYQQHASGITTLSHPDIISDAELTKHVQFRTADMNNIPHDLGEFDVVWSTCALEHLGTIELSLRFIEQAMRCVRPGGIAVHTFEYNGGSNDDTIFSGPTVLLRQRDLEAVSARLTAAGYQVGALDLQPGNGFIDQWIDTPPYRNDPWPRLLLFRHVAVSAGIVIRKVR
jgi:SAM-dependent methyltransferase